MWLTWLNTNNMQWFQDARPDDKQVKSSSCLFPLACIAGGFLGEQVCERARAGRICSQSQQSCKIPRGPLLVSAASPLAHVPTPQQNRQLHRQVSLEGVSFIRPKVVRLT